MDELHSLLKRQLGRFSKETKPSPQELSDFLKAINDTYLQFDADRSTLEHSLELTSQELLERNAELSRINTELEQRVSERTAELSVSEARFRGLFEHAPVSIWEEDFSAVRQYMDDLGAAGIVDFSAYFDAHPEAVVESAARVKVVDVNRATLEMFQAESKSQLLANLSKVLSPESLIPFKEELLALARGETSFENETINYTLRGERRVIFLRLTVAPGYEQTWAKVFVGISDITERRQAEAKLEQSEVLFRALFDLSPDAVIVIDPHDPHISWPVIDCNVVACVMNGYRRDELIGQSIDILNVTPSTEAGRITYMKQLREAGNLKLKTHHRRKNGDLFPVEVSTTLIMVGERELVIGIDRDITERKQTEDALREAEIKYRTLVEHLPAIVYRDQYDPTISAEYRSVYMSPQVEMILGYRPDEFIEDPDLWPSLLHPDDRERVLAAEALHYKTGKFFHQEYHVITRDGHVLWLRDEAVMIRDEANGRTFSQGVLIDITARKQAEEALREAELKYRTLVEHMPAIIYVDLADDSRNTVYISPQIQEMLGYSPEDWIAKPDFCNLIIHPEDSERMLREAQEAEVNGRFSCNYRYIAKDGHVVWVHDEAVLLKNEAGEPSVWQGVMLDITAQKQAEEALRQSEERFRLMAWATTDAVWDWDLQTNQVWWGSGLQKIFHYSSETEKTDFEWWSEHIHLEDKHKVERSIKQALDGDMEFWSKEYRFQRVDGTYADIMDRAYIMRDKDGKAYRMVGAMMDITERKEMESTLLQSNEKLGQFLEELQQRNRESALLNELSHMLQSCQSAQEAYGVIAELSKQLFPHTAGALYMLDGARTQINAIASWEKLSSVSDTFTPDNCRALRRSPTRPLNADQPGMCCLNFADQPGITYCLPIQVQGETIGIFHLQSTSEENLPENKRQLAYTVVERSEMALANLKLREALLDQSIRDPLTELYNRRYMEEALKQQLSRVTRQLHPLGLIMIDIDHFKNFNDAYGHAAGDALLRELGKLLQSHIRGGDVACRYGGEEFLLIMPDASLEAAHQRAKQLQLEAKKLRVQDAGQSFDGITLSLGVAIYPEHGRSIDSVLRAADAALYRAKQEGRDRVVVAERAY